MVEGEALYSSPSCKKEDLMTGLISLVIVGVYSVHFYWKLRKTIFPQSMLTKCIPMLLAMTSSLTIGLIMGIWMSELLAVSTILSVILSAVISLLIGAGFGVNGHIDAQSSSLMGAMMGVMLGVMLSPSETTLMIIAMDLIYLISFYAVIWILEKSSNIKNKLHLKSRSFQVLYIVSIIIIGISGTLEIVSNIHTNKVENIINHHHDH